MRISMMRKQRRAAGRPGALPNLRRICGYKTGVPTPQKGVRCGRPTSEPRPAINSSTFTLFSFGVLRRCWHTYRKRNLPFRGV